ncbi:hypothetical protein AVEN_79613-1, partial [Araneus ventricosus]
IRLSASAYSLLLNLSAKPCSKGVWLGKSRVDRGSSLWTVVAGLPTSRAVPTARGLANLSEKVTEVCHPSIHKPLMSDHLQTTKRKLRATPQSPEQQRFFLFPRWVTKRNADQIRRKTIRRNAA